MMQFGWPFCLLLVDIDEGDSLRECAENASESGSRNPIASRYRLKLNTGFPDYLQRLSYQDNGPEKLFWVLSGSIGEKRYKSSRPFPVIDLEMEDFRFSAELWVLLEVYTDVLHNKEYRIRGHYPSWSNSCWDSIIHTLTFPGEGDVHLSGT
jgi:hypothetical protein